MAHHTMAVRRHIQNRLALPLLVTYYPSIPLQRPMTVLLMKFILLLAVITYTDAIPYNIPKRSIRSLSTVVFESMDG